MTGLRTTFDDWRDRVRGCLLGGALGDAVGRPFEGRTSVAPADVARVLAAGDLTWTDDTAMTLVLAEQLAALPSWQPLGEAARSLDEAALAAAHAQEWQAEPWRGYGGNPPRIFRAVLDGGDWRAVAGGAFGGAGSLGNGGAMRAAPVGALPLPLPEVAAVARRAATVTHTHPEGQDGAAVVAVAASLCLRHEGPAPLDPGRFLAGCADHATVPQLRQAVLAVEDTLTEDDPGAVARVTGSGISAVEAVPAALSAFLHGVDDPTAAVTFAVLMGGDTDTVAAMAGALAGALHGERGFAEVHLARLEALPRIRAAADSLAARTSPGSS